MSSDSTELLLRRIQRLHKRLAASIRSRKHDVSEFESLHSAQTSIGEALFRRIGSEYQIDKNLIVSWNGTVPHSVDDETVRECTQFLAEFKDASIFDASLFGRAYERMVASTTTEACANTISKQNSSNSPTTGVVYTPQYVVEYIIDRAVQPALDCQSLDDFARFRILDLACGCGAFLVRVYKRLCHWYLNQYSAQPRKYSSKIVRDGHTKWRLTLQEKFRILQDHVFGVDLDPAAIDIAKKSLWLCALQGSNDLIAGQPGHDKPHLAEAEIDPIASTTNCGSPATDNNSRFPFSENVVCGNAIKGNAFCESDSSTDANFDWGNQFPQVKHDGGFDVVMGNPPYRRELDFGTELQGIATTNLGRQFRTARMDLWYYFYHRGIQLLKPDGRLSFITNAYWLAGTGAEKLIRSLRDDVHLDELFLLRDLNVFSSVAGQHLICCVTKQSNRSKPTMIRVVGSNGSGGSAMSAVQRGAGVVSYSKERDQLFRYEKIDWENSPNDLLTKISSHVPLGSLGKVRQGIAENPASINKKTNDRFGNRWQVGGGVFCLSDNELDDLELSSDEQTLLREYHTLRDLDRYFISSRGSRSLIYSTRKTCPDIDRFPQIQAHLSQYREIMELRRETSNGSNQWWHLHWPRDESLWQSPKIVCVQMAQRPSFVPTTVPTYVPFSANVFIPADGSNDNLYYVSAILNSRLMWKWFCHHAKRRGVGLEINGHVLKQSPIRVIDNDDGRGQAAKTELVSLVGEMLTKRQRYENGSQKDLSLEASIQRVEDQIDRIVYDLYGLSDAEVQFVNKQFQP